MTTAMAAVSDRSAAWRELKRLRTQLALFDTGGSAICGPETIFVWVGTTERNKSKVRGQLAEVAATLTVIRSR